MFPPLAAGPANARSLRGGVKSALVVAVLLGLGWLTALVPPFLVLDDARAGRGYDAQTLAWLDGRWDIPRSENGIEAFDVDGRYYIYFGPTPALLRLPFAELVARFNSKAVFVSLFLAASLGFVAALRVLQELTSEPPGPIAVLALAGPPLMIAARPAIYHEAIAWGSAFALLSALHAIRYLRSPALPTLGWLAACALLAATARELWMPGLIVLLLVIGGSALVGGRRAAGEDGGVARLKAWLVLPRVERPRAHAGLALVGVASMLFTAAAIHRAKFGDWGFVPPIERHLVFAEDPERLAKIEGRLFHLANLRTGLYNYLSPTTVSWGVHAPWIHPAAHLRIFPEARIDGTENMLGLPHMAGALLLSTVAGVAAAALGRAPRAPLVVMACLVLSASACFFFVGLCGRYLYDFFPALVVGGGLGWTALARGRHRWMHAARAALVLYNLGASAALAITLSRQTGPLPVLTRTDRLLERIDWAILRPTARLEDGRACAMPETRRIRLRLRDPGPAVDRAEPLVVTGMFERANFVSWQRFPDGTAAFTVQAWGGWPVVGDRFPVVAGAWYNVEIWFVLRGGVIVSRDGVRAAVHTGATHNMVGQPVYVAHNPLGGAVLSPRFTGELLCGW